MKILGSDFDGTFNHNGIDDIKRNAVSGWRSQGNIFAIVSGRPIKDLLEIVKKFSFECDYLVAHNGAYIAKPDGSVISSTPCDSGIIVPLLKLLFENGCTWASVGASTLWKVYADSKEGELNSGYSLHNLPEIPWFTQICTKCADYATAEKLTKIIREYMGDVINPLQNGLYIDIVRADMNKAKGIYLLMDFVGAKYEDVIVVGDNVNDLDMIKEFKSYAMENGVDMIKKIADYTTPGVVELIERESLINR